ncbi:MAG TPA: hypothetical protein VN845_12545 [Solirubrobacteraceae bacterium]|jgi:hypothetical protein|nr:hypothetical protein [Solirubrobacteraceae bacterium]
MPIVHDIAALDLVELTEQVGAAPAGARGGVLELREGDVAMVEITNVPLEPLLDRIVFAPFSKLRRID